MTVIKTTLLTGSLLTLLAGCGLNSQTTTGPTRQWLAGDSHIHSYYSPGYDTKTTPPTPIVGGPDGDAQYTIGKNAEMAVKYGLNWMVITDHGGPNHSKLNMERAYPELQQARTRFPQLLSFVGMELNMPAMDHHTLMIPRSEKESQTLAEIESRWDAREAFPVDASRNTEEKALQTINYIKTMDGTKPILMANHPARSATALGTYGSDTPHELRNNNDAAPNVYVGFEGAPGHQAGALNPDGSLKAGAGNRGAYGNAPTYGGFDQMTARLGGLWDSMLGEGRRFWIVATSDSHVHYTEGGADFWPGEYQKTYVKAEPSYDDILDGLRSGRTFVTSGDLISELDVTASTGPSSAATGGTLKLGGAKDVTVTIRLRDPAGKNFHNDAPEVKRVDLIVGRVTGKVASAQYDSDTNPTTTVERRLSAADWKREGEIVTMTYTLKNVSADMYVRVRGTTTDQQEPAADPKGENPWADLWFYSNPIFIEQ
ncbi:hypothetical protein K7W42_18785 [Deinococcus sp. HMF7604]|uniref:hypothetical protein n=1 Tax=Deinococcus betulae TaxID=2873312 RepID=UPI001CCE2252|nr:hypothetical protein [Deinococcus betulae]MBZ9752889.1 hypothetical protein [Deinococcus betulae]